MTRFNNDSFGWPQTERISGLQDMSLEATAESIAGIVPVEEMIDRRVDDVLAMGNTDPETVWAIQNNGQYISEGRYRDLGPNSYI